MGANNDMNNSHSQYTVYAYPSVEDCIGPIANRLTEFTVTGRFISNRRQIFEDALCEYRMHGALALWSKYMIDPSISFDDKLDAWESFVLENCELLECPLEHTFPDGLYVRKVKMPAGAIFTSRIHACENALFILSGKAVVMSENEGQVIYKAGDNVITKPGTRRLLLILEDTIWATVHPNPDNVQDVPTLEEGLTYVRPLIKKLEAVV